MAGLGETCTHIAAVLFYLEAVARLQGTKTVTESECSWIIPSYLKSAQYLPIKNIDFTSARGLKRKLDGAINNSESSGLSKEESAIHTTVSQVESTSEELDLFFKDISMQGTSPAVLSLVTPYSDKFIPKSTSAGFPKPLNSLYQPEYGELPYDELLEVCQAICITITASMAESIEAATKAQSGSKLWFQYRAGRVTASRMKAVCHTNESKSLIKCICYPEVFSFTSKQTSWGCKHEKVAKEMYLKRQLENHHNLEVKDSGLCINTQWPFIGASPDGIISCQCHDDTGVLEIKCPYCHRDDAIESAASKDTNFCLKKQDDGSLVLDHGHAYYYQVQTQLFVCNANFCDFCVCTFGDKSDIYIERIFKNQEFWDDCVQKAKKFFDACLLPELIGHWYTQPRIKEDTSQHTEQTRSVTSHDEYCYCHGPEKGRMIGCDNPDCSVQWFHMKCLKLKVVPKGNWYCPDCTT